MKIYSQTPHSSHENYLDNIISIAKLSEEFGYTGILVTYSSSSMDPLMISQELIKHTSSLRPLIAVPPSALPSETLVKMLQTSYMLSGRVIDINVINGVANRLSEPPNPNHHNKYDPLVEYIHQVKRTISEGESLNWDFFKYTQEDQSVSKSLGHKDKYEPSVYLSGTSVPGLEASFMAKVDYLTVPQPIERYKSEMAGYRNNEDNQLGICLGIISRPSREEAIAEAYRIFPQQEKERVMLAFKRGSKMSGIKQMAELALENDLFDNIYWTGPFKSTGIMYPYFIGSYEEVAAYIQQYVDFGVRTLILNIPFTKAEFVHRDEVFKRLSVSISTY
ncbi:LLM class flavin-dependent oxidoreductase [Paenibacillus sp. UMB4589-SE434]|uniref:LLM class flavin-dependent oxidoreductase n=1 Tax=Paenibacillus sp. UMB4589-SE434 TaxID=3046314 RepID=UPI0025509726|nr:LLM class flavin-dependent oxidoreductase [Paenibacillus sp. UMB4589-SE434]MDK8182753.1 LLM class flavin-dependent oxidoreductase [Paenibacillus sp. UMB4589-SE434]